MARRIDSVETVVELGFCAGCGLCSALAGRERIDMAQSSDGQMRPVFKAPVDADLRDRLVAACPGATIEGPWARPLPKDAVTDPVWGPATALAHGYAADPELRFKGATGGILSALALHLLETGAADFILHVEPSDDRPMRSNPRISRSRADVVKGGASRYGPVAPLVDFGRLLDLGRPFAVVAKPCDIAAIRNLARTDPRVDRLVVCTLAMICEGVPYFESTLHMATRHGLAEKDVRLLRYRGHGWPGRNRVEASDGRIFEQSYIETWRGDMPYRLPLRCKICPDSIGLQADIATGDAWRSGNPRAELEDGWNCTLARSRRGAALLREAEAAGRIVSEPLTFRDLDAMQPQHLRRRRAILPRLAGIALAGLLRPRFRGLNLWRTARRGGVAGFLDNLAGAARRVGGGRTREQLARTPSAELQITKGLSSHAGEG